MRFLGLSVRAVVLSMLCQAAHGGFVLESSERNISAAAGGKSGGDSVMDGTLDPGVFNETVAASFSGEGSASAMLDSNVETSGDILSAFGGGSALATNTLAVASYSVSYSVSFTIDTALAYDFEGFVLLESTDINPAPLTTRFISLDGPSGNIIDLTDAFGDGLTQLELRVILEPGFYTLSAGANGRDLGFLPIAAGSFGFALTLVPAPGTACLFGMMSAAITLRRRP